MSSQCPVGYELVNLDDSVDCPTVEDVFPGDDNSSLFLIKFPPDFDMSSLSGQDVVLNGSQDLVPTGNRNNNKRYELQSKVDCSAELSSFSALLPSSQSKSLYAASAISGQMSVIRTVSVPPPTLPDSCVSQAVQRQSHNEYVKKWKPFGYRKPPPKSKEKKTNEPREHAIESTDGGRKQKKDRKTANLEETSFADNKEKTKSKENSPKKKKKDKGRDGFDKTQVKTEPELDANTEIPTRNGQQSSQSGRKRKMEVNDTDKREGDEDMNGLTPTKLKKENKGNKLSTVKVKREFGASESPPKLSGKQREANAGNGSVNSVSELRDGFDLARVKIEPRETSKKAIKRKK